MTVFLCGQKSCGKTTYGRMLSEKLGVPFFDLDDLMLKGNQQFCSCREIYIEKGETEFRRIEYNVLSEFIARHSRTENNIFSLGGGSFESPGLAQKANSFGRTVYIYEDRNVLFDRMKRNGFPPFLLPDPVRKFPALFEQRDRMYRLLCFSVVRFSDLSLEEICQTVSELF